MRRVLKSLRLISLLLFGGGVLASCGKPDPLAAFTPGEEGRVVRVIDGDALVLDTGLSVRLIGIEAPSPAYKDREEQVWSTESRRSLEDMALGRRVRLGYAGLTRDRYDRALAHVMTTDDLGAPLWLNLEQVMRGAARVRIYPDTALGSEALLAAETVARDTRLGLWAKRDYAVLNAGDLPENLSRFEIIEGVLGEMQGTREQGAACEIALSGSALRLEIGYAAAELCQLAPGTRILARGSIYRGNLEVTHLLNLQVLK